MIVQAYREALSHLLSNPTKDRQFLTEAMRARSEIQVTPGDAAVRLTPAARNAPPDVVGIFAQFFEFE